MIIIRLAGGLGNQIFQLGIGLCIAKKQGNKSIILDCSALGNYAVKRKNELYNFFNLDSHSVKISEGTFWLSKLRIPVHCPFSMQFWPFVGDKNIQNILHAESSVFRLLDGYFQSSITQDDFDEEILLFKNILISNKFEINDGCVVHIRGGDFVKLGWNSVTPAEYYINAMQYMNTKFGKDKFYIVTDDRKYSESILKDLDFDYEFIGHSMQEDFYLIGSFRYRILSSSTFALWASALGDNEDSVVIAPKHWTPERERKIFLPNEIRI